MDDWKLFAKDGLEYLSIDSWLKAGVNMAFSARQGGSSSSPYDSLNMGLHVEDEPDKVLANRRSFMQLFQADLGQAVCCRQVHGDLILKVDKSFQGRGAFQFDQSLADCDGMITNEPGVYLLTFYADCIPVFFFDPIHRAVGIAHSGWKGTMERIAAKTIKAMQQEYSSRSEDLLIGIGPGIGACCFEISADLAAKVNLNFPEYHDIIIPRDSSSYCWNLSATVRQMLIEQGVNPENISVCQLCTSCHPELLFSHRRDQGKTGRMGGIIALEY